MNDFHVSVHCLSRGFLTWHRFAKEKIVRLDTLNIIQTGNPKDWDICYPLKFELLFDQKHKDCEEIAKGKYSKVYQLNNLAYKSIRIQNKENDHSNLRCNIKELIFFHSLCHSNIMRPHRSQIIMEHGTITRIIHEMPLADCHLGEILTTIKSYQDIKFILHQVALAMQYMHNNKLNHGDLKPQNILLINKRNLVQLSDFTLTTHQRKGFDNSLGTLFWRSPESINEQVYTDKSDVWSFGVIMLDCLIGSYYFQNAQNEFDLLQLINRVIDRSIVLPLHIFNSSSSDNLDAQHFEHLIYKILVINPLERPSFEDILQDDFFKQVHNSIKDYRNSITLPEISITERIKQKLTQCNATFEMCEITEACKKFEGFLWDSQWFNDETWESVLYHVLVLLDFKIPFQ
jgi:serine/threonine protein kinase